MLVLPRVRFCPAKNWRYDLLDLDIFVILRTAVDQVLPSERTALTGLHGSPLSRSREGFECMLFWIHVAVLSLLIVALLGHQIADLKKYTNLLQRYLNLDLDIDAGRGAAHQVELLVHSLEKNLRTSCTGVIIDSHDESNLDPTPFFNPPDYKEPLSSRDTSYTYEQSSGGSKGSSKKRFWWLYIIRSLSC